jgi:hypothetical protein
MNYKIKMSDKTEFIVPENVGEAILEAKTDRITWNKRMINLKSISSVQPEAEELIKPLELTTTKIYTKRDRISALEGLTKGLNLFISGGKCSFKSKKLLDKMKLKLTEAQGLPENSITTNPINELI